MKNNEYNEILLAEIDRYKRSLKEARTKEWAEVCRNKIKELEKEIK